MMNDPITRNGLNLPNRVSVLSMIEPMTGSVIPSKILITVITIPITAIFNPSASVLNTRKNDIFNILNTFDAADPSGVMTTRTASIFDSFAFVLISSSKYILFERIISFF